MRVSAGGRRGQGLRPRGDAWPLCAGGSGPRGQAGSGGPAPLPLSGPGTSSRRAPLPAGRSVGPARSHGPRRTAGRPPSAPRPPPLALLTPPCPPLQGQSRVRRAEEFLSFRVILHECPGPGTAVRGSERLRECGRCFQSPGTGVVTATSPSLFRVLCLHPRQGCGQQPADLHGRHEP